MADDLLTQATVKLRIGNYFLDRARKAREADDKDRAIKFLYLAVAMFGGAGNLLLQQHRADTEFIAALPMPGAA